ncbi:MAG: hypothetical protein HFACDABA_01514 [Anaerolineales bacterium]|nr:hypothetical protein [Anaerolineales bacterium]
MQAVKQMGGGLLLGILSLVMVFGGILLALTEGYVPQPALFLASQTPGDTAFPTSELSTSLDFLLTAYPSEPSTPSPTLSPPTSCIPPMGWVQIPIVSGETIEGLAARHHVRTEELIQANCLPSHILMPGSFLYAPALPSATAPSCGAHPGWVHYTVQAGDTLFKISTLYRVTVPQLQNANCLGSSSTIFVGQALWVPNVPTSTPAVTATIITIEFATVTPTPTDTPALSATSEPSATPAPSATPSPTGVTPPASP